MGFEPMTSCMPCKRSSQLSYTPKRFWFCGAKLVYFSLRAKFYGNFVIEKFKRLEVIGYRNLIHLLFHDLQISEIFRLTSINLCGEYIKKTKKTPMKWCLHLYHAAYPKGSEQAPAFFLSTMMRQAAISSEKPKSHCDERLEVIGYRL